MAYYSIGEVAERCGINPVTLRAWQRRYGLLKPQRREGGHRQFDDEDILRIEEIKRLMKTGVSVGKVKALLENTEVMTHGNWASFQEEMLTVLRYANPAKLRAKISEFRRDHAMDVLIDNIITPVRQRMNQDQNTVRHMASLLDGVLSDHEKKQVKMRYWLDGSATTVRICGWKRPVLPTRAGISTCWLNPLILHVRNFSLDKKFSSGPVKHLRLVNRSSSTTGVNRVSPSRSITDVKGSVRAFLSFRARFLIGR